ncbi:penicillin acylase family protein [Paucibacter sp. KBW04]|uniref:penicillin acylase family protein n=1 Tax=Paucibacter sp. KBW04 TaxID=2153361 RepID=UPI000F567B85|nr:penicillin acylase family protein [Paucibacter sp. KBW04]RQO57216.1 penicillin acylase family protein [Paucibacter sp. KBW04]
MSSSPATLSSPKTAWRWLRRGLLALLLLALVLAILAWALLRASLPQLNGRVTLPGLQAPLSLARDDLGTVIVQGENRLDLARGLGFVHAQERFFEMDLTRRSAAGELSALFGAVALERDKQRRMHRMRERMQERLAQLPAADRALLEAYASGVNAGLAALRLRPWQYLLLRAEPEPWAAADSALVVIEMFWMLQGTGIDTGFERAQLRAKTGDALFDWLNPRGGRWDAALDGSQLQPPAMPTPEQLDLRQASAKVAQAALPQIATLQASADEQAVIGSNNWAVAGRRSEHGGALLADDMHLGLGVPSIWFRTQLQIPSSGGRPEQRTAGLSLPGMPSIVVGSNGAVAWGFTNAYGQWFDWIQLPANAAPERLKTYTQTIAIKGQAAVKLELQEFDGAPVLREQDGQRYALRWIAHQGEAVNLELDRMLLARHVDEALGIAQRSGMPHQNIVIADSRGQIAWTVAGRLWSQQGLAKSYARIQSADEPAHSWTSPADYPLIKNPKNGQLWTANNRQLGGAAAELIADGGFDLGARAQQIRDRLSEKPKHDEASLMALHLDNEARFMQTWGQRLLKLATASPQHAEAAELLRRWNGRADAEQAGYRLIRAARLKTLDTLWLAWTEPFVGKQQRDEKQAIKWRSSFEYPASQALDQQPAHLLPPAFASWDALLLAQLDAAAQEMRESGKQTLAEASWGQRNHSKIQHVLSKAIPPLAYFLDMPGMDQGGDSNLPHVAAPAFGQSQRLVVSPGREAQATLSMPGGQSGHPMSPFYGAGHGPWARGEATPLLAGKPLHQLDALP